MTATTDQTPTLTLTISGAPGTGKTTVAHAITHFLAAHGVAVDLADGLELDPAEDTPERHHEVLLALGEEGAPGLRIEVRQTPRTPTIPTLEQCIADPTLAAAVRELAARLDRQDWLNNSRENNEQHAAELEEALAVAEEMRGPHRLGLPGRRDAKYRAGDAAVTWLRDRLAVVRSAIIEQRGVLAGTDEIG